MATHAIPHVSPLPEPSPRDDLVTVHLVFPDTLLGDAKTVSHLTGFSVRTIRRMDAGGEMPRPIRKGRKVLWRLDEIRRWVEAGCPDRKS